jgi:capsular exopolysaccharide synthesis family protein
MLDLDQNLDRQHETLPTDADATVTANGSGTPDTDAIGNAGPIADYQKAKQEVELLQAKRASMAQRLRPAHPDMIAIDQQIETQNELIKALRSQSVEELKTRRDSIQIQIQNLEGVVKEWEAKALDLSTRMAEYDKIKTKEDRAKEEYERLLSSMNSVTVTKNVDQDSIMIMEQASPGVSVKPGWGKIILAGMAGGLLVGLGILFCIDQLDDRIGSFIELQSQFPETILGQIPREKFTGEFALLHHNDDRFALLEAFRSLRSSLIFFPTESARPKTLVITSALPNEGKTTISANLAITMAFSGAKTLVIDADMRRGKLSHLFGVTEGNGLSSILMGIVPWKEAIHQTTVDNLSLISCGPPLKHPAEHLLGRVADQFLKEIYAQYDYVIFDSPPVTLLDDTLSLAPKVDGTMVVVRFGVSSVRTTRRTLELLGQRQTNVLGLICNDVHLAESEYNYGYYYRQTIDAYSKDPKEIKPVETPESKDAKEVKAPV